MSARPLLNSTVVAVLLSSSILLSYFPGLILSAIVTLDSLEIYKTHEWLKADPTIYFKCNGENITVLPDVKKEHVLYSFKGEESWQPLLELATKKCKRCGFYEKDKVLSDDVFDEWELCASEFTALDGKYIHFKEKELNATFLCPECVPHVTESKHVPPSPNENGGGGGGGGGWNGMHILIVIAISALVSSVTIIGLVSGYKYWLRKRREHEQARFLKLFEDGDDDMEEELGISPLGV